MPDDAITLSDATKSPPANKDNVVDLPEGEKATDDTWRDGISQDIRFDKNLQDIKSLDEMAKGFINSQKLIGNSFRRPEEGAAQDKWDEFYGKLGRPESVDKYSQLDMSEVPEGMEILNGNIKEFSQIAHKFGLTDMQHKELMRVMVQQEIRDHNKTAQIVEEEQQAGADLLKTEFGTAMNERVALAKRAYQVFMNNDQKLAEYFKEAGLENDPYMVMLFSKIGGKLLEDRSIDGQAGPSAMGMTPDEAKAKIATIRSDLKGPYYDEFHPKHSEALEEVRKLYTYAHPPEEQ